MTVCEHMRIFHQHNMLAPSIRSMLQRLPFISFTWKLTFSLYLLLLRAAWLNSTFFWSPASVCYNRVFCVCQSDLLSIFFLATSWHPLQQAIGHASIGVSFACQISCLHTRLLTCLLVICEWISGKVTFNVNRISKLFIFTLTHNNCWVTVRMLSLLLRQDFYHTVKICVRYI